MLSSRRLVTRICTFRRCGSGAFKSANVNSVYAENVNDGISDFCSSLYHTHSLRRKRVMSRGLVRS